MPRRYPAETRRQVIELARAGIDAAGDAAVLWLDPDGIVTVAVRPGATGEWLPAQRLSSQGTTAARIVVESSGELVTAWAGPGGVQIARRGA